jgi:hypothetical protein
MKIIPEQSIVTETRKRTKSTITSSRPRNEELHRRSMFETPIKCRGKDGRTYDYIDEDGKYISHYVSQFSPLIDNSVEPEVLVLVRTLHSLGYLTMGSCQGHANSRFRWVTMVFTHQLDLENFKQMVDEFGLPVTWYDNFLNFRDKPKVEDDGLQISLTWDQKPDARGRSLGSLRRQGYTEDELTKYLNVMYEREESKYYLTKMVISSKIGESNPLKKLYWSWKYRERNKVTEELVDRLIQSGFQG